VVCPYFIVQAAVILGAEIQPAAPPTGTSETEELVTKSIKVIRWLMVLSDNDASAKRAWYALSRLLLLALANAGRDTSILSPYVPSDTSLPQSFTSSDPMYLSQKPAYLES
jgi:hypothetical protein